MSTGRFSHLFTSIAQGAQPSAIREICKLIDRPGLKSLAGGWPDPATFPTEEIREITADLMQSKPERIFQYGPTEGLPALREELSKIAKRDLGFDCQPDDMLILHGSQQGMDLAARVFIEPGDVVIAGLPTYFGGSGAVRSQGGEMVGVPVDDEGMNTDLLAQTLNNLHDQGKRVKGVYVIPNFQNPTGVTLSLTRRKRMLKLAEEHDLMIFEDDPYGDLRFEGEALPSLKALDTVGRVIHMHSFSKIFVPGLRLAWLAGETEVVRKMAIAKQFVDCCTNSLAQYVALEFIRRGYLQRQIKQNSDFYRNKRDVILELMERHFPKTVRWNRPLGGFFLFVHLPEDQDVTELLHLAVDHNVAFVAGAPFYLDGSGKNTFRLSFSQVSLEDLAPAIETLGDLLKQI